jgi:hypothetical protein
MKRERERERERETVLGNNVHNRGSTHDNAPCSPYDIERHLVLCRQCLQTTRAPYYDCTHMKPHLTYCLKTLPLHA